jgi:hypothetical protein
VLSVKPGQIFWEKMNLFLKQTCDLLLFWSVPNCYAIATQEYLALKGSICKYLIASDLRLGSSVGRAEDWKSTYLRLQGIVFPTIVFLGSRYLLASCERRPWNVAISQLWQVADK